MIPPRPLLAYTLLESDFPRLSFPLLASPKIDGFRAMACQGKLYSRTGKEFKNRHLQAIAAQACWHGFDGELGVGDPTAPDFHEQVKKKFNTFEEESPFIYYVFDLWTAGQETYGKRAALLAETHWINSNSRMRLVPQTLISDVEDLLSAEENFLASGWEGLILRSSYALYKHGRSTFSEGALYKLKRFQDDEAEIIGWEERMLNENEQERNPHGYAQRSSSAEGKYPAGDLGAFKVRVLTGRFSGAITYIGSGFTSAQRISFWRQREYFLGLICTFKHFLPGAKDLPRHLVWKGLRGD